MTDTIKDFLTEEKRLADSEKVLRDAGFNGWYDWDTWNCALWIGNDERFYEMAQDCRHYGDFLVAIDSDTTPDGALWADADYSEMNALIQELN